MREWDLPLARGGTLRIRRPLVMGILNVTPDSFSDGGELADPGAVQGRARRLAAAGADLLDVGGESTRPGHAAVSPEEELARVLPALRELRAAAPAIPVSIDTRKAAVARAALDAGADLVNDVSGLGDPAMAKTVRRAGCSIVLMRHRDLRGDPVASCQEELAALLGRARAAGVPEEAVLLDPGLGFGDPPGGDPVANLRLLGAAREIGLGRPVVVGASRKRFLGRLTGEPEAARRVDASVAAALLAVESGAAIVRVHDVAETVRALRARQAAQDPLGRRAAALGRG